MIDKSGNTIADITLDTITVQNIEAEAADDASLKELAKIHERMRSGENGFGSYQTIKTDGKSRKNKRCLSLMRLCRAQMAGASQSLHRR